MNIEEIVKVINDLDEKREFKNPMSVWDLHVPGAKADKDKPDLDLVLGSFAKALFAIGEIGTVGARKYSENGWLEVSNGSRRYSSAMLRHIFLCKEGEKYDKDSGQLHLAHVAWNALAVLELYLRDQRKLKVSKSEAGCDTPKNT